MTGQIPEIQPLQFESDDVGKLPRSVNMFRGDVNYAKSLVQLPGKPGDATLAVSIGLQYASNVSQDVAQWNLSAPTGIVGLGWSLAWDRITASGSGALSDAATEYAYVSSGVSNALVVDTTPWLRATLDEAAAATLTAGDVSSEVVRACAAQGLAVDPSAHVAGKASGAWTIADPVNERVLAVNATASGADVHDGGIRFQLHDFSFWQISYYPLYEKWEVTTEKGEVRVFGGGVSKTAHGYNQSSGNSVEWAVKWGGATGNWSGPAQRPGAPAEQSQYAIGWNLVARRDRWGDEVRYAYNEFDRDPDGVLGRNAEQRVGVGGLPYTKAVYPTTITDLHGRTVRFGFGDKSYTAAAQEYMDPHKVLEPAHAPETPAPNLGAPNAYQDRYETLYLASLTVASPGGAPLYAIELTYPDQPLLPLAGGLAAPSAKRLLTSIQERSARGEALPAFVYDYCTEPSDGPNLGALKSITYPQGSQATWSYADVELPVAQRALDVVAPAALGGNATPLVWCGDDYVVSAWVSQDGRTVMLDVYTWNGAWQHWSGGTIYSSTGPTVVAGSAQAAVNTVSFAVAFATSDGDTQVMLFNRDHALPARWHAAAGAVKLPGQQTALTGGDAFILATAITQGGSETAHELFRWTYDWRTGWVGGGPGGSLHEPVLSQTTPLFVLAQGEYYLTASASRSGTTLAIFWLDGAAHWRAGDTREFPWTVGWNPEQSMVWASGPSCIAASVAAGPRSTTYGVQLARWDRNYDFCDVQWFDDFRCEPIDAKAGSTAPWPPLPEVTGNQFVGVRGNLFRYDGIAWATKSFPLSYDSAGWLAIAYGDDYAVQAINDFSDVATKLLPFDANAATGSAFAASLPVTAPLPSGGNVLQHGWPSASDEDFFVARNAVFFRGADTSWQAGVQAASFELTPTQPLAEHVRSQSVINQSPAFLAYLVSDDQEPADRAVQALPLRNGTVRQPLPPPLDGTAYLVADSWSSDPGAQAPSGPATLVTYPATAQTFGSAQQFTLYRYVGQALSGPIAAYPVRSLTVTDGFGVVYRTAYEFDAATALSDPTGTVIKFYRSASYDGAGGVADSTFGRTVFSFYNGTTSASAYSALDGRLHQQVHFAGAARFQRQWSDALGLGGLTPNGAPQAVAAGLSEAFAAAGSPLGAGATVQMVEVDDVYVYWQVDDPAHATAYNLDYTGDPRDPAGLRVFDGQAVTSRTTQWTVFTTRNSDPTAADKTPLPLHGGYSRPSTVTERCDGVPLVTTLEYVPAGFAAPFSGLPVTESFGFVNLSGAVEQHVKARKYASEVYREVLGSNLLTPVVQTRQTVATGGSPLTVAATATTGAGWTHSSANQLTVWGSSEQWVWSGDPSGVDVGEFPFGSTPSGFWQRNSTANARNDAGLIVDSTDASGLRHGTLYDRGTQAEVALVSNGSFAVGQAAYAGFEAYEDLSAWSLTGGAALDDTDANSGSSSLRLPPGGAATRAAITPDPAQPQFFSTWVKTPAGYTGGAGSGWTLTVRVGADVVCAPIELAFADTGGAWRHVCAPLDLKAVTADTTGAVTVTVAAANAGSAAVWVDDMVFVPLAAQFIARAYDPLFMLPSDRLDQTGKHWRTLRDPFMRPVGGTDAAGNPTSLQLTYLSRAGNDDAFEAADPNASLAVKSFGSGRYESFRDGQGWQAGWTAEPAGAWEASSGVLRHASTAAGATLTPVKAPAAGELALYLQLVSLDSGALKLTDDFSIAVGDATFTYGAAARAWKLTLAGRTVPPLGKVTGPPAACLLVQTGGRLLLYADGQLLFAQHAAPTGAPVVSCGANAVGLASLALFAEPALNLHFSDATGMLRQQQVLTAEDYLVQQTVRDARGKPIVHTKPAPGAFESGADLPVPAYRPGFVDIAAFAAVLEGSSVMKGDVAKWYDGHNDTDDAGYPYSRCLLEPSSLARTLELGFPGAALAIVDPGSTPPGSRATVQNQYGSNTEGELDFGHGALPPQSFQVHRQVGQTKVVQVTISDASRTIAARMVAGDEPQVNTTQPRYAPGTTTTVSVLPDAFSLGETGQQVTRASNAAGHLMGRRTPDGDAVRLMYDSGGRVRFAQDAQGALDKTLVYLTWDALGRRLSRGTVDFEWTEQTQAELRGFADEQSWPESQSSASFTRLRAWSYDGDGSRAASVGQLVGVTSSAGGVTVAETFAHNSDGSLAARTVDITDGGRPVGSFSTAFVHDAQGRLTSIAYPGLRGTGVEQVRYRYDGRDNVLAITDGHGRAFAAWTYNPLGKPATVALGEAAARGDLTWDPAGRLVSARVASRSTSFSYDLAYAATGALQALDEETRGDGVSDAASVIYKYDELERLLSATDAHGARTLELGYATSERRARPERQPPDDRGRRRRRGQAHLRTGDQPRRHRRPGLGRRRGLHLAGQRAAGVTDRRAGSAGGRRRLRARDGPAGHALRSQLRREGAARLRRQRAARVQAGGRRLARALRQRGRGGAAAERRRVGHHDGVDLRPFGPRGHGARRPALQRRHRLPALAPCRVRRGRDARRGVLLQRVRPGGGSDRAVAALAAVRLRRPPVGRRGGPRLLRRAHVRPRHRALPGAGPARSVRERLRLRRQSAHDAGRPFGRAVGIRRSRDRDGAGDPLRRGHDRDAGGIGGGPSRRGRRRRGRCGRGGGRGDRRGRWRRQRARLSGAEVRPVDGAGKVELVEVRQLAVDRRGGRRGRRGAHRRHRGRLRSCRGRGQRGAGRAAGAGERRRRPNLRASARARGRARQAERGRAAAAGTPPAVARARGRSGQGGRAVGDVHEARPPADHRRHRRWVSGKRVAGLHPAAAHEPRRRPAARQGRGARRGALGAQRRDRRRGGRRRGRLERRVRHPVVGPDRDRQGQAGLLGPGSPGRRRRSVLARALQQIAGQQDVELLRLELRHDEHTQHRIGDAVDQQPVRHAGEVRLQRERRERRAGAGVRGGDERLHAQLRHRLRLLGRARREGGGEPGPQPGRQRAAGRRQRRAHRLRRRLGAQHAG